MFPPLPCSGSYIADLPERQTSYRFTMSQRSSQSQSVINPAVTEI
jgi:hypothetical protein